MSGFNSDILWAQGALSPAQRTMFDMLRGQVSDQEALEYAANDSVYNLAGKAKNRFANNCVEIEALWQKCQKSGDFSAFQADVTKRFADAVAEDLRSQPQDDNGYMV